MNKLFVKIKRIMKKINIYIIRLITNKPKKNKILISKHYDKKCCHYEFDLFGKIINFHTISYGCCHKYFEKQ